MVTEVHTTNQGNWCGMDIPSGQEGLPQVKGERNCLAEFDNYTYIIFSFNPVIDL